MVVTSEEGRWFVCVFVCVVVINTYLFVTQHIEILMSNHAMDKNVT